MGPNEKKLREAIVPANFNPAVDQALEWAYHGLDVKWVMEGLREVAPRLGDYGITGSTAEAANDAFLRLADEMDQHRQDLDKAVRRCRMLRTRSGTPSRCPGPPADPQDPGAFSTTRTPRSPRSRSASTTGKADQYDAEATARETAFADALAAVDTQYYQSSVTLSEVHGMEPPADPYGDDGGGTGGGGGTGVPGGGAVPPGGPRVRPGGGGPGWAPKPPDGDVPWEPPRPPPPPPPTWPPTEEPPPRDWPPTVPDPDDPTWPTTPTQPTPTPGGPLGPSGPLPGPTPGGGAIVPPGSVTPPSAPSPVAGALAGGLVGGARPVV